MRHCASPATTTKPAPKATSPSHLPSRTAERRTGRASIASAMPDSISPASVGPARKAVPRAAIRLIPNMTRLSRLRRRSAGPRRWSAPLGLRGEPGEAPGAERRAAARSARPAPSSTRRRAASRRVSAATVERRSAAVVVGRSSSAPSRRMPSSRSSRLIRPARRRGPGRRAPRGRRPGRARPSPSSSAGERTVNQSPLAVDRPGRGQPGLGAARPRRSSRSRSSCWPSSSARVPAAATRPRSRITTRSQTRSTSPIRCELSSTATPRGLQREHEVADVGAAERVQRAGRLVEDTSSGRATSATARPSRCCMPLEKPPTRSSARSASPTSGQALAPLAGRAPSTPASRTCSASTSAAVSHGW